MTPQGTRLAPRNREDQYGADSDSTRTTPDELGAWTKSLAEIAIPTCVGPIDVVLKNTRSPGSSARRDTVEPRWYCSATVLGTNCPCCAKTYSTKPLQSNPDGSLPPSRYGAPRSDRAVPTNAFDAGADSALLEGGDCCCSPARGKGLGTGTAPLDAQPPAVTAKRYTATRYAGRIRLHVSDYTPAPLMQRGVRPSASAVGWSVR